MAKIIACDGCDGAESETFPIKHVAVTISTLETVGGVKPDGWDLCAPCQERIRYAANPTTWERKKVRKPRTPKPPPAATGGDAGEIPANLRRSKS